jgi:hypothetical protein
MQDAENVHRKAVEQHDLAAHSPYQLPNIMKKAITKLELRIRNEHWSSRIKRTSWQWKPTPTQVES